MMMVITIIFMTRVIMKNMPLIARVVTHSSGNHGQVFVIVVMMPNLYSGSIQYSGKPDYNDRDNESDNEDNDTMTMAQ